MYKHIFEKYFVCGKTRQTTLSKKSTTEGIIIASMSETTDRHKI